MGVLPGLPDDDAVVCGCSDDFFLEAGKCFFTFAVEHGEVDIEDAHQGVCSVFYSRG